MQQVQIWHMEDDSLTSFHDHDKAGAAAFFPNGTRLVTTSGTGTIRIWDIKSSVPLLELTLQDSFDPLMNLRPRRTEPAEFRPCRYLLISSDGGRMLSSRHLWDLVNYRKLAEVYRPIAAIFTPNGHRVVFITEHSSVSILDAITGAKLYYTYGYAHISLMPTRCFCLDAHGGIDIFDIECHPAPIVVQRLSCIYPPDRMAVRDTSSDTWYYGENGARLIWLPEEMRRVWLATGSQSSGSYRLVLGGNSDELTIMDMEDYMKVLPAGTWRKGGVRYADPTVSNALVSASGMMVRGLATLLVDTRDDCWFYKNIVFSATDADSSPLLDPYDINGEDDE